MNVSRGLTTYFFLGLAVTTAVPLLAAGVFEVRRVEAASHEAAERQLRTNAEAMARETRSTVEGHTRALESLAGQLESGERWPDDLQERLVTLRERYGGFNFLYVASADGVSFAADAVKKTRSDGKPLTGTNYSDRPYFVEVSRTHKTVVTGVEIGRVTGVPGVHVAVPVLVNGALKGFVVGALDLVRVTELADAIGAAHPQQRMVVFDRDGRLLAKSSSMQTLKRPFAELPLFAAPTAGSLVRSGVDDAGEESHAAVASTGGDLQWTVAAFEADDDIDADALSARRRVLLVALFTIVLGLLVSAAMANWLGRPMRELAMAAEQAGDGNLLAAPRPRNGEPREVAILLGVVQKMFDRLRSTTTELEETVKQRTLALTDTNAELEARLVELRDAQTRLGLADRMASVGTLAAGVGHEINNPLAYVLGNLQYVIEQTRDFVQRHPEFESNLAEQLQALIEAEEGAQRVKTIVRDLRVFARAAEDDTLQPVDVRKVLETCINMSFNEIKHRARLDKSFAHTRQVLASEGRLSQVFLNMMVNAAQSIREGAAERNFVRVATYDEADDVVVEIADSGSGISSENLSKVFDPFFTTKAVGQGTGLGLAISQRIVSDLKGRIMIDSAIGKGTTFRIALPSTEFEVESAVKPALQLPTTRRRVLVIDDEEGVIKTLGRILGQTHDVEGTPDATEALRMVSRSAPFDVIFCDVMMPQLSGMEFLARLTLMKPEQADKVVFMTGGAFSPEARAFVAHTSHKVIEKPFTAEAIKAAAAGESI